MTLPIPKILPGAWLNKQFLPNSINAIVHASELAMLATLSGL